VSGRRAALIVLAAVVWTSSAFASRSSTITGSVRSSAGKPQMGATVEVFSTAATSLQALRTVFTDEKGAFALSGLLPGSYLVRVSAPSFLPTGLSRLSVSEGAHLVLNFTLNTVFDTERLIESRRATSADADDWRWTLRASGNRPVLRVLDPGQREGSSGDATSGSVAVMAGGGFDGLGGMPSVTTDFQVNQAFAGGHALDFRGRVGYGGREPDGMMRVAYTRESSADQFLSSPELAFTVRRSSIETPRFSDSTFNSFGFSVSQTARVSDAVAVRYGSHLEAASVVGPQVKVEPFVDAEWKLGHDTRLTYRYEWMNAQDADYEAKLSVVRSGLAMERARRQEVGVERKLAGNTLSAVYYMGRIDDLALRGIGQMDAAGPDMQDDILAGSDLESFTTNAGRQRLHGVRVSVGRKMGSHLSGNAHYSYGTALDTQASRYAPIAEVQPMMYAEMRSAAGADATLALPKSAEIEAAFNATFGPALTSVDQLDAGSFAHAPYLNIRLRQPLPSFLPGKMEAVVDVRNLLAQGYRPVLGEDGRTLYLVQAPRSLRGGIAFSF